MIGTVSRCTNGRAPNPTLNVAYNRLNILTLFTACQLCFVASNMMSLKLQVNVLQNVQTILDPQHHKVQ